MSLSSDGFFKSGRTIACFNDFGITPSSTEAFVIHVMAGTIRVMLSVSWFAGRGSNTHVFLVALHIAVISVFVVWSNTSIQSVKQRLSSDGLSMSLKHCRPDRRLSIFQWKKRESSSHSWAAINRIQVVAVHADHRAISVDETCFCCLPFPVDFENNPFWVRISTQYIHPGRWRIIVDESPVLFFSTHSPIFAFYSWRHRCQCHSVVSRTRTLRHGACLSRQSVRQVLYTCTNLSACWSFVHAHMSLHTDVIKDMSSLMCWRMYVLG